MTELAIDLRRATAADAESLSAFAAEVFPLGGRPETDPIHVEAYVAAELNPGRFLNLVGDPRAVVLIAEGNRTIVGYAVLLHHAGHPQIPARYPAELRKIYVHPDYHGQGVADALMRELLSSSRPNTDVIWLSVFSENARAIGYYTRWGFRFAGNQVFMVGADRQKDFLMRRQGGKSL
jgi:ribosomal protein S18 acetylase RimI-like enzyme